MRRLPLLTTSAAAAYRSCPRYFFWSYEELVRPAWEGEAREFGTLGHRGLEAWWTAVGAFPREPDRWLDAALAEVARIEDPYTKAAHRALVIGYHVRWSDEALAPITVESEYTTPLVNPATGASSRTWQQAGKIDVLARDANAEVWVLDHKYTRTDFSPGSDYRRALILAAQPGNYINGARALGYEPRGWIHDVIARPSLRPRRATAPEARRYTKAGKLDARQRDADESPEEYGERLAADISEKPERYYARFPVVRLESELQEAAFDLWQVGIQIRESRRARAWPRNGSACLRWGSACDYLPICLGQADPDDPTRYRRAARAHEELEESNEDKQQKKEGEAA